MPPQALTVTAIAGLCGLGPDLIAQHIYAFMSQTCIKNVTGKLVFGRLHTMISIVLVLLEAVASGKRTNLNFKETKIKLRHMCTY